RHAGVILHRNNFGTTGPTGSRDPQTSWIKRAPRLKCARTPFCASYLVSFYYSFEMAAFDGRSLLCHRHARGRSRRISDSSVQIDLKTEVMSDRRQLFINAFALA